MTTLEAVCSVAAANKASAQGPPVRQSRFARPTCPEGHPRVDVVVDTSLGFVATCALCGAGAADAKR